MNINFRIWCVKPSGYGFYLNKKFPNREEAMTLAKKCEETGNYTSVNIIPTSF